MANAGFKEVLEGFIDDALTSFEELDWRLYGQTPDEARTFFERMAEIERQNLERFFNRKDKPMIGATQLAKQLGLSPNYFQQCIRRGALEGTKVSDRWVFTDEQETAARAYAGKHKSGRKSSKRAEAVKD